MATLMFAICSLPCPVQNKLFFEITDENIKAGEFQEQGRGVDYV